MTKNENFYCIFCPKGEEVELWAGPCKSKTAALMAGEMSILDTFGSKSKKYIKRVNGLVAVNQSEAKYLKVI